MEGIEKLPKWAQEKVAILESRLANAEAELSARKSNAPSRVMVEQHMDGTAEYLTTREVTFVLGVGEVKSNGLGQRVRVRLQDSGRITINGDDCLAVMPQSANHVEVALLRR